MASSHQIPFVVCILSLFYSSFKKEGGGRGGYQEFKDFAKGFLDMIRKNNSKKEQADKMSFFFPLGVFI